MSEKTKAAEQWETLEVTDEYGDTGLIVVEAETERVIAAPYSCDIDMDMFGDGIGFYSLGPESDKFMRKIAAAPDMFDALKDIANGRLQMPSGEDFESYAVRIAKAAIAKAESEAGE